MEKKIDCLGRSVRLFASASVAALLLAGPAFAQECLGTAEDLHLTDEQRADIGSRGLTFGYLTNNISDDFSRTLVSGGEGFATWVWLNSVQQLARGIVSLINGFSPEIIIIGGGITKAGEALTRPLQDLIDVYEWRPAGFQTPIVLAEMGGNAGAIGAALFAKLRTQNS